MEQMTTEGSTNLALQGTTALVLHLQVTTDTGNCFSSPLALTLTTTFRSPD
jgi:hypothetical protein